MLVLQVASRKAVVVRADGGFIGSTTNVVRLPSGCVYRPFPGLLNLDGIRRILITSAPPSDQSLSSRHCCHRLRFNNSAAVTATPPAAA